MRLSPEITSREEPSLLNVRGPCRRSVMACCGGPAGVREQGIGTGGFPRNLGRPTVSASTTTGPWGWPDRNTPGPKPASGLAGANTGARGSNRLAKETKWDGKDGRDSERSIVPLKPGNACRADPGEGRGRLVAEPWPGNSAGASDLDQLSTRRPRVAQGT